MRQASFLEAVDIANEHSVGRAVDYFRVSESSERVEHLMLESLSEPEAHKAIIAYTIANDFALANSLQCGWIPTDEHEAQVIANRMNNLDVYSVLRSASWFEAAVQREFEAIDRDIDRDKFEALGKLVRYEMAIPLNNTFTKEAMDELIYRLKAHGAAFGRYDVTYAFDTQQKCAALYVRGLILPEQIPQLIHESSHMVSGLQGDDFESSEINLKIDGKISVNVSEPITGETLSAYYSGNLHDYYQQLINNDVLYPEYQMYPIRGILDAEQQSIMLADFLTEWYGYSPTGTMYYADEQDCWYFATDKQPVSGPLKEVFGEEVVQSGQAEWSEDRMLSFYYYLRDNGVPALDEQEAEMEFDDD